jgi:hypothetical protein
MRQHMAQSSGMSGLGEVIYTTPTGVKFTSEMEAAGYRLDEGGSIYWPNGGVMFSALAYGSERPRVAAQPVATAVQTYVLPNGQRAAMTPEQYMQYLAALRVNPNAAAPGSLIASGLGSGFESFAQQFGVSSTTLILLAIGGFYLLMKPPPERKR